MEAANKAWWRDTKIYRSKDVSWRERCRRMVEHVCNVYCLGNENWCGSRATMDRIRKWETKAMRWVFRFKKEEDETWANCCARAARAPKACGEQWDGSVMKKPNAVIHTLKQVFRWRSTKSWQSTQAVQMKKDPNNHTRWKHMWAGTTAGVSGTEWLLNGLEMKT